MTPLASASTGLHGALLLARGRAEGAALVEQGPQGALHSFWAMAACLPFLVLPHLGDAETSGLATSLAAYLVAWLAFAVLSHRVAAALGAGAHWFRFIAVWNWCSLVQQGLVAAGSLPALLGVPGPVPVAAVLLTAGWAIWLEWYAARVALGVGGLAAAALVLLDYAIALTAFSIGSAANGSAG